MNATTEPTSKPAETIEIDITPAFDFLDAIWPAVAAIVFLFVEAYVASILAMYVYELRCIRARLTPKAAQ